MRSSSPLLPTVLAVCFLLPSAAAAAEPTPEAAQPRVAHAERREGPIRIDGRLDEEDWRRARTHGGFWQRAPNEGTPPRADTEFRVLYDDDALYVAVRALDPEPSRIRGRLTRRDQPSASDWITVGIDSYHDRRTAFTFALNPAGVQRDVLLYDDVESDPSWDAIWEGAAAIDEHGWVAELRIPYSQLRFAAAAEDRVWGLQVTRTVQRTAETTTWAPWPRESSQNVSVFGELRGLDRIAPPRRLELLPYLLAGVSLEPAAESSDRIAGAGLDLKVGLGSSFTLSGTVNPDFGQVEADPSQVNLSANETFFPEKRPFFIEGADIFRFSLAQGDGDGAVEQLFYTRRIGGRPHASAAGLGDQVEEPDATTIYGAGKLSGKTAGGWSLGLLGAVTAEERARVVDEGGESSAHVIEPRTSYSVLRLGKDGNQGRTTASAALTMVHRDLDDPGLAVLHRQAYAGGLQLGHRFPGDRYAADLRLVASHVRGDRAALAATQRAPQRYFQRPDAAHLTLDPERTSLSGLGLLHSIGKIAGGKWRAMIGGDTRSPGLEVNDLGFQHSADRHVQWLWLGYRDDRPGDLLLSYSVNVNGWSAWTFAPEHLGAGGNVNFGGSLRNHWGGHTGIAFNRNRLDPGGLRGGPALRRDDTWSGWHSLWSDTRRRVSASLDCSWHVTPASSSWGTWIGPAVGVQALANLELRAGPSIARRVEADQFVAAATDDAGGTRYVLGRLSQTTTALTVRVSYTLAPNLGLQLYAQPFASSGRYRRYKEVDAPRAERHPDRYHVYGDGELQAMDGVAIADRGEGMAPLRFPLADFSFRELRSNFVLRWEYRPGSTLFLIWSHDRHSFDPAGDLGLRADYGALAAAPGEHVLLAKLTWWYGT